MTNDVEEDRKISNSTEQRNTQGSEPEREKKHKVRYE